jgi:hypothetical protein
LKDPLNSLVEVLTYVVRFRFPLISAIFPFASAITREDQDPLGSNPMGTLEIVASISDHVTF